MLESILLVKHKMVQTHFSVVEAKLIRNNFPEDDQQPERMNQIASGFISRFKNAVESADADKFDDLIADDGYWRDIVSFTNDFRCFTKVNVLQAARDRLEITKASGGKIEFAPKFKTLDEHAFIEFGFRFSTDLGPAVATVRLVRSEDGEYRALYSTLRLMESMVISKSLGTTEKRAIRIQRSTMMTSVPRNLRIPNLVSSLLVVASVILQ